MKIRNPASASTLGGAGSIDRAAERVDLPYRSETSTKKAPSMLDQLRALADGLPVDGFQHFYGPDRPPGRGWWSPLDEGPNHHVRAVRRRRR